MINSLQNVRTSYDRWAVVYDHDRNPLQALEEPVVRAALGDVNGLRALDLGCGTGRHALWFAEQGAVVTAVDFSEGMLAEARQKLFAERVHFLQHDLHEPLPFEDGEFDVVVSGLVLEHIQDLPRLFLEIRRVVKPEGRVVISAMHPAMFLRGSQARFTDPDSGELVQPGSVAHTVSVFVMAAVRSGFQIDAISEHAPDAAFAVDFPRAEKYIGWPMLVVMTLKPLA
jgi:ubiquinone/menaquinone biosynthesis C-methylase UbiE